LDLQKQLSVMDRKAAKDNGANVNGESIMSMAPVDKV
jgi:vacuolar protein sorting-associated protein 18